MSSDLERRVEELERRARSLPWTVFALMLAVLYCVCVQYKINDYFKNKFRSMNYSAELKVDDAE